MPAVQDAIAFRYNDDAFRRVVYSESHDEVANGKARVPQEVNGDDPTGWYAQKRSTLAAALVFTAPGIPMIFQGQEFLQGEWFRDDVPLDWAQRDEFKGIVRLYRDLIRARRRTSEAPHTTRGLAGQGCTVFHVDDAANVIAFQRWAEHGAGDDVVVLLNFSAETRADVEIGMPAAGTWQVRVNTDSSHYSADFGNTGAAVVEAVAEALGEMPARARVTVGAYSALVMSQDG